MRSFKTLVLKIDPKNPGGKAISQAAEIIRKGGLVAFPTETVYGIAANLLNEKALDRLYEVKGRPRNKPFTVHISDVGQIEDMGCAISGPVKALIDKYWPGPITIILMSSGGKKIGFRMPANKTAIELIRASGVPVAAPSANLSGAKAPDNAEDVLKDLDGKIDLLLDAGPTDVGVESTVVDMTVTPPDVLREGAVKASDIIKAYE